MLDHGDSALRAAVDGHGLDTARRRLRFVEVGGRASTAAREQLGDQEEHNALIARRSRVLDLLHDGDQWVAELALDLGRLGPANNQQYTMREEQHDEHDLVEDQEEAVGTAGADQAQIWESDHEWAQDEHHKREDLDDHGKDRADLLVAQLRRVGPFELNREQKYAQVEQEENDVYQAKHDADERAEATCVLAHFLLLCCYEI